MRATLVKRLRLAALALLGMAAVSIPVTIALVLSATGASDLLTIGDLRSERSHATPAKAVSALRCEATRGHYALTFDDGPLPESTRRLVAVLRRSNAVATFFDVGRRAAAAPELVELQRTVGQVASHGYSHVTLTGVSRQRRVQELQATARALDFPNDLIRPPDGATDAATEADIRASGLRIAGWTVDTLDQGSSADAIVARALAAEPGGIVRMHDGVAATLEAVPRIVAGLRERGMCPGFLAPTARTVRGPDGTSFHVMAVEP